MALHDGAPVDICLCEIEISYNSLMRFGIARGNPRTDRYPIPDNP